MTALFATPDTPDGHVLTYPCAMANTCVQNDPCVATNLPMPSSGRRKARIPRDIQPEDLTVVVDTREQQPWYLAPLNCISGTLATGDYTIRGLENVICIERKSLSDLMGCVGQNRERFEKEMQRMLAYPTRAVLVEAEWQELEEGDWRSQVTPAAAIGSVLAWISTGVPFLFVGNHERAGRFAARLMFLAARRRWRESREIVNLVLDGDVVSDSEVGT